MNHFHVVLTCTDWNCLTVSAAAAAAVVAAVAGVHFVSCK